MNFAREARAWLEACIVSMPGSAGFRLRRRCWARSGPGASIAPGVTVAAFARLRFGSGLTVGEGCRFDNSAGDIIIGNRVAFNRNVTLGADFGRIQIGDDSIVGPNVVMRAANHRFNLDDDRAIRDQGHVGGEIVIGKGAWISANVVILAGARIGDGAVIGAGAVVRGEIPTHSLAVGVPARIVKRRQSGGDGPAEGLAAP